MSASAAWLQELRAALPDDAVADDRDVVAGYSRDMVRLATDGRPAPGKIFAPAQSATRQATLAAVGR